MAGPVQHRPSGPYRSVAGTVSVSQSTQGLGRPRRHRAGRPRRAENAETLRHPDQLDGGRESLQWGQSSPAGCAAAPRRSPSTGGWGALVQVQVAALAFAPWLALAPGVPAPTAKHGAPPASRRNNPAAGSHWPARKRHRVSQSSRGGGPSDVVGPPGARRESLGSRTTRTRRPTHICCERRGSDEGEDMDMLVRCTYSYAQLFLRRMPPKQQVRQSIVGWAAPRGGRPWGPGMQIL